MRLTPGPGCPIPRSVRHSRTVAQTARAYLRSHLGQGRDQRFAPAGYPNLANAITAPCNARRVAQRIAIVVAHLKNPYYCLEGRGRTPLAPASSRVRKNCVTLPGGISASVLMRTRVGYPPPNASSSRFRSEVSGRTPATLSAGHAGGCGDPDELRGARSGGCLSG